MKYLKLRDDLDFYDNVLILAYIDSVFPKRFKVELDRILYVSSDSLTMSRGWLFNRRT